MMTTSVGCGDGCELPYDRIKESGDFRSCHDVRAMSALWSSNDFYERWILPAHFSNSLVGFRLALGC
jgi:hypothetical protein